MRLNQSLINIFITINKTFNLLFYTYDNTLKANSQTFIEIILVFFIF